MDRTLLAVILALAPLAGCGGTAAPDDAGALPDATAADASVAADAAGLDAALLDDAGPEEWITPDDPGPADVRFEVSSARGRHAISPYVYGTNQPDEDGWHGETLLRLGGNRWTAYNWETNASNAGADYFHQNDAYLGGGDEPGGAVRGPVERARAAGAAALVTVPIAGYVSADKDGGGDVAGTPDYLAVRFHESRPSLGAPFGAAPDLGDRAVHQDEFVDWVRRTLLPSGPVLFSLDNEPDLWSSTHPRIHPDPVTYAEMIERNVEYATAITRVVPDAIVLGPVNYGYAGFRTLQDAPDAGGREFLDVWLGAMADAEVDAGRRLVHALDVHWYPEARGGGQRITGEGTSEAEIDARLQAPRSLWDPTYVEDSWITDCCSGGAIRLIPWMQDRIDAHYPGTRIAITEYNYGATGHVSGGVAHADVLGILGREDVFLASWWQLSAERAYVDAAFDLYRDFDGAGARFGDTSIEADTDDDAASAVHASVDASSPARMVLVAINRTAGSLSAGVRVEHVRRFGRARVFRLTSAGPAVAPDAEIPISLVNAFLVELPARSATVLELLP